MITLRMMSTALLWNSQNELLMMKRSLTRSLSPGLWAAIGGHLEPSELNNPRAACLREVWEETGIEHDEIQGLRMQYVLLRLNGQEVRQQFFYIGTTDVNPRIVTPEGDLHWIPKEQVLERPIPFIFRCLLEHYFSVGLTEHPWVGSAGIQLDTGEPTIHWNPLVDPLQT
ncbi:NUDIX domain-containing protein [Paenibacillus sp. LMG 31458]|uniref:NUDIX domain-containing protein n=1 Tax=Paenibacillus phytorum TaxID=2654977 RepID=A0ABX1XXT2_9BACL|nr:MULTISPECIES: NUDIX hydrolase [Paenibacillus]KQX49077.1 NUDIX hydrolase [Paenibacillus sp. Root444D2]KRE36692.1 NUDIX hydrolase [Paenibacillus sp. Soil724D2]NOU73353.1 NUDIX domain-containing protein [Paenibacillus phytorum]